MDYAVPRAFFFQAEDGIRDTSVTGVQTCALPISAKRRRPSSIERTPDDGAWPLAPGRRRERRGPEIGRASCRERVYDAAVVAADTESGPIGMGTGGSRVAANAGPAVATAAREVRTKAARVAAELLECAPQDVRIEASRAVVSGMPDRALPLGRLAHAAV